MNTLLAKTKGINSEIFKILSQDQDNIFSIPDLSENQEYSSDYSLEDNEWYKIDTFSDTIYLNELIGTEFNSTNYNQITTDDYSNISYLCCKQDNYFLFQKFSPTQFISKKWISISDEPSIQGDKPIIVLYDHVDAVYNSENNVLYFKKITKIKSIFEGIEALYREATQEEVNTFLMHDFIELNDEFTNEQIKPANRKRIAMAMNTLENFSEDDKENIFEYTKKYCSNVPYTNTAFIIGTEKHLKLILFGIEQRYYTTPLGGEKRLANSVLKMES